MKELKFIHGEFIDGTAIMNEKTRKGILRMYHQMHGYKNFLIILCSDIFLLINSCC
ncbi:MAG: hypothetical protein KF816_06255 [Melioribacteraceae bacterium]|nr:hypothetical protein [Melioribacteraceae bacterium]